VVAKSATTPAAPKLTAKEQAEFKECEKTITNNYQSAFQLAEALHQIRNKKLYRAEYKTFEEYCSKKWEYSRSYCTRLIEMNEVVTELKQLPDFKDAIIRNEGQARVFVNLAPPDRIKLLNKAKEVGEPENITAKQLAKFKKELFPDKSKTKDNMSVSEKPVVDAELVNAEVQTPPNIITVVNSAKTLLDDLIDNEGDDSELGRDLREFIKASEAWCVYQKAIKQ
jgi:ATP-dependent 26S proteasome regulatory subunit